MLFTHKDIFKDRLRGLKEKKRRHLRQWTDMLNDVGIQRESAKALKDITTALDEVPDVFIKKDGKEIYYRNHSPACTHCVCGVGNTQRITRACNRQCFFCFPYVPPSEVPDKLDLSLWKARIRSRADTIRFKSFAISGGEPLLYPAAVFELLDFVNRKYGENVHTRIYTNGDFASERILKTLQKLKLDEIRFSIKPFDEPNTKLLQIARKYIPSVVIEMPVLPGTEDYMKELIVYLNKAHVTGINLLELFFNGHHLEDFKKRGYRIDFDISKLREYYEPETYSQYPVFGSKVMALDLLKFFSTKRIAMFMNFCSLERRHLQFQAYRRIKAAKTQREKMPYASITDKQSLEFLAVYGEARIIKKIRQANTGISSLRKINDKEERLETSTRSLEKIRTIKGAKVVLLRQDPSGKEDVDAVFVI